MTYMIKLYEHRENDMSKLSDRQILLQSGAIEEAIVYSSLFMPRTEIINEMVFLRSPGWEDDQEFLPKRRSLLNQKANLPKEVFQSQLDSFNWVEVAFVVGPPKRDVDEEIWAQREAKLAELMRASWDAHLSRNYAERRFLVRVLPHAETGSSLGVGFTELLS